MLIRKYKPEDCESTIILFYETVHNINSKHYSKDQLDVWATGKIDSEDWNKSFLEHYTLVAEEDGDLVGFGDIFENYLDRLYVHKDYQNRKIATKIVEQLENYARENNQTNVITHASITAKPFFEKRGYALVREQKVERQGIFLKNFVMKKML